MNVVAVELRGISKAFLTGTSRVVANEDVNLVAKQGSIHAIVGENGAGKSTAMKILFGMQSPDSGEVIVGGRSVRWANPTEAMAGGIGMVHQHFMLAGPYTVLENVVLGCEGASAFSRLHSSAQRPGFASSASGTRCPSIRTRSSRIFRSASSSGSRF